MTSSRRAILCFFLSLVGLGLCAYLGFLHIALQQGELLGGVACGTSGGLFNCHAVTGGRFGSFLEVPLWVWGAAGYLAAAHLALLAVVFPQEAASLMSASAVLSAVFVIVDALLFAAMLTQIHYLCFFCLMTYAVNVALLLTSRWAAGGLAFGAGLPVILPGFRKLALAFWGGLSLSLGGLLGVHAATAYLTRGAPGMLKQRLVQFLEKEQRVAIETQNDPLKGSSAAPIELVEFSDFFCPACQKAAHFDTIFLAGRQHQVRLVFKNYPLDMTCNDAISRQVHAGACAVAAAAECAHRQGKFWPLHDAIFAKGHDYSASQLKKDVGRLGMDEAQFNQCLASGEGMEVVRRDVAEGKRLGISSTPTFFVNGRKMPGIMTPAVFEGLLQTLKENPEAPFVSQEEDS